MAVIIPGAIAGAVGLYNAIDGGVKSARANKMAANIKRPTYNIPQGEYDNVNLLSSMASTGLDGNTKQVLQNNADRGLSSGIGAILRGGGDPNAVSSLYDNYLSGLNSTALADDAAKVKKVNNFVNARYRLDDDQDKAFQVNEYAPYSDQMQRIAQLRSQGATQTNAGLGGLATGAMSVGTGLANQASVNALALKPGSTTPTQNLQGMTDYANRPSTYGVNSSSSGQPSTTNENFTNNFGIDLSKLSASDAAMTNSILFGNDWNGPSYLGF